MTDSDFRESFHLYKDVVYRFAWRMTGSGAAAEDVVQDCFTALWERRSGYDAGRGALRSYLLGIARNLVLKRWRRERLWRSEEPAPVVSWPIDPVRMERSEAVAMAVQALPPLQREALVLAEYEELALEEIARLTQCDLAAVKSRLHRARQNLRRMLAPLLERKGLETKGNRYGTK